MRDYCSCGCGYEIGSREFQDFHVREIEEEEHDSYCFCTRCDG